MCTPECACAYADDGLTGRTDDGEMGGLTCVRACDPVCENGMIDARSDG